MIGVVAATGAIFLVYMADFVMGFFGRNVPLLNDSGPWGIAISGIIVVVAALNLILDFDLHRARRRRPVRPNTWSGTAPSA